MNFLVNLGDRMANLFKDGDVWGLKELKHAEMGVLRNFCLKGRTLLYPFQGEFPPGSWFFFFF